MFRLVAWGGIRSFFLDIELPDQHAVLVSDAIFPSQIYSWFIAENHSFHEILRIMLHAHALWTFVHAEVVSYSMTGAMSVGLTVAPQVDSC